MTGQTGPGISLHDTVATAFVRAREAMRPHDAKHADARLTSWLDRFEAEMRDALTPALASYIDHPDVPPEVSELFRTITNPTQAVQSGLLFAALGALFYPLVSAAMAAPAASVQQASFHTHPSVALSPAEVALADIRGALHGIDPATEVSYNGIGPVRYQVLHDITGEPPAIEQLLLLYRRGQIDRARLEHGILQSRIRNEWIDAVENLRFAPPPAGEVIAGALKAHLSHADAQRKLGEAGIDPANFDWMLHTAGRPYGTEQALELLNRGEIDEARVRQVIAQSDVNPDYTDDILKLRVYLPPPRSVVPMLRAGSITEAQARQLLAQHGVPAQYVDAFIGEAHTSRTGTVRDLSQAQVLRLYGAQLIDRAAATARLEALNMTSQDVALLLDYADSARHERYQQAIITRVHARFVGHNLTEAQARAALAQDQVPAAAIDDLMKLWVLERDANRPSLTTAEVLGAWRRGLITRADFHARLSSLGWDTGLHDILAGLAFPPTAFKNGPDPPASLATL